MVKITASFNIVTPLFMSGANQEEFELRGASFKGVLRFWWRALAHSRLCGNLQEIHKEESRIFGSSETGQGYFSIRISQPSPVKMIEKDQFLINANNQRVSSGTAYLGYGLIDTVNTNMGKLKRPCLLSPSRFTVYLLFRNTIDESVVSALKIMGLLGGMGSRSRRGFGSLTLEKIEGDFTWIAPVDVSCYKKEVASLLSKLAYGMPEYSAFTAESRITLLTTGKDAFSVLDQIGNKMQIHRSWQKEKNFKPDHDLIRDFTLGSVTLQHPDRVAFGLPHNYFFSSSKAKADIKPESQTRRASPLIFHIHKFGANDYAGFACILPSQFLPVGEQINIMNKTYSTLVPQNIDYRVLHNFIDGFKGEAGAKDFSSPYFPDKIEIYP